MTVEIEQIQQELFDAVDNNPYLKGVDPLACAKFAIDYLHSRGYLGVVPDGYVLVPKEPTVEMEYAGLDLQCDDHGCRCDGATNIYKAMIATAPKGETK